MRLLYGLASSVQVQSSLYIRTERAFRNVQYRVEETGFMRGVSLVCFLMIAHVRCEKDRDRDGEQ